MAASNPSASSTSTFERQLRAFMYAIGQQESGNNYGSPLNAGGSRGYYQFQQGTTMYAQAQSAGWTPAAQDSIAAQTMTSYFNGPAQGSWFKVAEMWNGGQPYPIPNPALGPGATTATYAAQVMGRFQTALSQGLAPNGGGKTTGTPVLTTTTSPSSSATTSGAQTSAFSWSDILDPGVSFINQAIGHAVSNAATKTIHAVLPGIEKFLLELLFIAAGLGLILLGVTRMFPGATKFAALAAA